MKRQIIRYFAFTLLIAFSILSVYASDVIVSEIWFEPTAEQIQEVITNRMPLPEEKSTYPSLGSGTSKDLAITRYYFDVQFSTCALNRKYNPIGFTTYKNTRKIPVTLQYSQAQTMTTQWNVTGNISVQAAIQAQVISKIQAPLGVLTENSATMPKSLATPASMILPSRKTGTIYAYHSAVEAQGTITWTDADEIGNIYAVGTENVGGAFILDGVYFENQLK